MHSNCSAASLLQWNCMPVANPHMANSRVPGWHTHLIGLVVLEEAHMPVDALHIAICAGDGLCAPRPLLVGTSLTIHAWLWGQDTRQGCLSALDNY